LANARVWAGRRRRRRGAEGSADAAGAGRHAALEDLLALPGVTAPEALYALSRAPCPGELRDLASRADSGDALAALLPQMRRERVEVFRAALRAGG